MVGAKIDCYIDVASFYSRIIYEDLLRNQGLLASHGVKVDFHPIFLGGVMRQTGNSPPWMVPAKAQYGMFDARRAAERVGVKISWPENFTSMNKTLLPMRALTCIKSRYPRQTFEATFRHFFNAFWTPPHLNLTDADVLRKVLLETPSGDAPGKPLFTTADVDEIIRAASEGEFTAALRTVTDEALAKGAFGAPWLWVTNRSGKEEPFFGSDRLNGVYKFLGLPYQEVALLPPDEGKGKATKEQSKL